jgi:hypothetical protein
MNRIHVISNIAMDLAVNLFGYKPPVHYGRERSMQSPTTQYHKMKASREKRERRMQRNLRLKEG